MPVEFIVHVGEIKRNVDQKIETALEIIGGMAEGYAKGYAPVDTGNLRNSITHETTDNGHAVVIGSNVQYAPYQELGAPNAHVPAHPYLRPAIENHLSEYQEVMKRELGRS